MAVTAPAENLYVSLKRLPGGAELALSAVVIMAVGLMILPVPAFLVDVFVCLNLGFAVILLVRSLFLESPVEMSSLPGLILLSTIFRLALSVTTTRLILSEGYAGQMIETFGEFVVAGNVIVGLVIFFIIILVNLTVIAKGSERVAEVSARFTLDAMPGKQMAIDADLRNGEITQEDARARRAALQQESQFFGSMDGAMKFVKGDAIAGIIIILINLIGGLLVGMVQLGMNFGDALSQYSLLSIGDALIAQVPALFVAISAGVIVTRVASADDADPNLGQDITNQLLSDHRALQISAATLAGISLVPGMPTLILLAIAAAFAAPPLAARWRAPSSGEPDADGETVDADGAEGGAGADEAAELEAKAQALVDRLEEPNIVSAANIDVGPNVMVSLGEWKLKEILVEARNRFAREFGFVAPIVDLYYDKKLPPYGLRCEIEGVPVAEISLSPIDQLIIGPQESPETDKPKELGLRLVHVMRSGRSIWSIEDPSTAEAASDLGEAADNTFAMRLFVADMISCHAAEFMTVAETNRVIERAKESLGDIVTEAIKSITLPRLADVLQRLIAEDISISNIRLIMQAVLEFANAEPNPSMLTELVRSNLKRQITNQYAGSDMRLDVRIFDQDALSKLTKALVDAPGGSKALLLEEQQSEALKQNLQRLEQDRRSGSRDVILTSPDLRRHIFVFAKRNRLHVPVLCTAELSGDAVVEVSERLTL
ncbi:MAG: flagellar biosynthesis protein FlhA [Pseudomonadota bacterium]